MKTKYRNIKVEVDGVNHEVAVLFTQDSVEISPSRRKAEASLEEFPVRISRDPEGLNSAGFFYEKESVPSSEVKPSDVSAAAEYNLGVLNNA